LSLIWRSAQWLRVKTGWHHFDNGTVLGGLRDRAPSRAQRTVAAQLAADQRSSEPANPVAFPARPADHQNQPAGGHSSYEPRSPRTGDSVGLAQ